MLEGGWKEMMYDIEVDCGLDGKHRIICGKCKKVLILIDKDEVK